MIRVHTLGGLAVRGSDGKPLAGSAAQPRRMAVLALVARAGERGVVREKILALLWPDSDDQRGPRALAQALYALRKDLGAEDAIVGSPELRLDPAVAVSDVQQFLTSIARGDDEGAAAIYHGPFLDGFHLSGAEEFTRWVEGERAALAQDYMRTLESLARAAIDRGDAVTSVKWWRKAAGLEPLNARMAIGMMEALAASGDRAAAIRHAHIYELLIQEELDLPPDREVMALANRLRQLADQPNVRAVPRVGESQLVDVHVSDVVVAPTAVPRAVSQPPSGSLARSPAPERPASAAGTTIQQPVASVAPGRNRRGVWWVIGILVALAGVALFSFQGGDGRPSPNEPTVIAVGRVVGYGNDSIARTMADPVSDLLATNLARVPGLRVVSPSRMLELMPLEAGERDTSAAGYADAARRARATSVIDGTLYARPGGRLRLDLRRIDLKHGTISDARTIEGNDFFTLVDSGTARLVAAFGTDAPRGSVVDVTTHSVAAYRMYSQALRAFYRSEYDAALSLFDGALRYDSLFALAAYYGALSAWPADPDDARRRMDRAQRLAARAPELERLTITADWANRTSSTTLRPTADTLARRYPSQPEGHYYSGIARIYDGEFLAAVAALERVVAMDSLVLADGGAGCFGCLALAWIVGAYESADSMAAAERVARRWVRLQPENWNAVRGLIEVLEHEERWTEADSLRRTSPPADAPRIQVAWARAVHELRAGDYATADQLLSDEARSGTAPQRKETYRLLTISLREQGRLADALSMARQLRRFPEPGIAPGAPQSVSMLEAQTQLDLGRAAIAAALFDSVARVRVPGQSPADDARRSAWALTHAAEARVAAGDTAALPRLADSIRTLGIVTGFGRDRRLHHHVRGLLWSARRHDAEAVAELQAAIYSTTAGYSRTNYELARVFLRGNRPREAVAVLRPALRRAMDASNLFVTRTEIHELLAKAWEMAGVRDSAVTHLAFVARAWSAADPPLRARADSARARLGMLKSPAPNARARSRATPGGG